MMLTLPAARGPLERSRNGEIQISARLDGLVGHELRAAARDPDVAGQTGSRIDRQLPLAGKRPAVRRLSCQALDGEHLTACDERPAMPFSWTPCSESTKLPFAIVTVPWTRGSRGCQQSTDRDWHLLSGAARRPTARCWRWQGRFVPIP